MNRFKISVLDAENNVIAEKEDTSEINLFLQHEYAEGDRIVVETEKPGDFVLSFDDALQKSLVYITGRVEYSIPFGEKRFNLSPKVFYGNKHLITMRAARDFEAYAYRNLAFNTCDGHKVDNMFPHAVANVETRGESVFEAKNAIDGVTINNSHGDWPYASWGINRQDDALIRIDFGREVETDRLVIVRRADFPHDNWWKSVHFDFSDGSELTVTMEKGDRPVEVTFPEKCITWAEMNNMLKADDPSPFPALTQIEIYGVPKK